MNSPAKANTRLILLALEDVQNDSAFSYSGYDIPFVRWLYQMGYVEDVRDWPLLTEKGRDALHQARWLEDAEEGRRNCS